MLAVGAPIQATLDPHGAYRTGRGCGASQDAMVALAVGLDRWHIEVEASQCMAQRFVLCGDTEAMQLLFKRVEVRDRLGRFATLTQKILELIHGMGITGQGSMTL